ncbi:MAG: serine hydrolase [Chloroflexi bacterium]|nr:serine hydrolase [Chloroflexota bacterium]
MSLARGGTVVDRAAFARLDQHLLGRYVDAGKISGCVVLVAHRGAVVHLSALGMMDLEAGRRMEVDSIFRVYSMSKPITSVAMMQLHERGLFQLSDPVSRFIPEWRGLRVFAEGAYQDYETREVDREMTMRDLLSHQSGLTYGFQGGPVEEGYFAREVYRAGTMRGRDLQSMVERLSELPLKFSPGEHWNYGLSTDVCGYLIEVISGRGFDEYLSEHVFDPLGMVDSGFHVPADQHRRLASSYELDRDGRLQASDMFGADEFLEAPTFLSGGGGLVSTAEDYWRFCQMMLNSGELDGVRVLGRKTVELMTMNHLPDGAELSACALGTWADRKYDGIGFGLGFAVVLDPVRTPSAGSVGEYYWEGSASTTFWIDPVEELVVVFMTQLMPSDTFDFRGELKQVLYAGLV